MVGPFSPAFLNHIIDANMVLIIKLFLCERAGWACVKKSHSLLRFGRGTGALRWKWLRANSEQDIFFDRQCMTARKLYIRPLATPPKDHQQQANPKSPIKSAPEEQSNQNRQFHHQATGDPKPKQHRKPFSQKANLCQQAKSKLPPIGAMLSDPPAPSQPRVDTGRRVMLPNTGCIRRTTLSIALSSMKIAGNTTEHTPYPLSRGEKTPWCGWHVLDWRMGTCSMDGRTTRGCCPTLAEHSGADEGPPRRVDVCRPLIFVRFGTRSVLVGIPTRTGSTCKRWNESGGPSACGGFLSLERIMYV